MQNPGMPTTKDESFIAIVFNCAVHFSLFIPTYLASGGYSGIYINFSLFSLTSTCTIYFIRFTPVQTVALGWDSIKLWGSRFLLSLFLFLSRAAGNPMVLDKSYQKDAPLAVIRGQFYNPAYFCLSTLRGVSCPYCTLLPHARSTSAFVFSISQSVVALLNYVR